MNIFHKILLSLVLIGFSVLMTGCTETLQQFAKKPDIEVQAIKPDQAIQWGETNKDDPNARLFTVHSDNMKDTVKWMVAIGIDVDWIKSGDEIKPEELEKLESSNKKGQKGDKMSPSPEEKPEAKVPDPT